MKRLLDHYYRLLKIMMTLLMALMIVPVSMQVLSRHSGLVPRYIWTEEVARFCFVWVIMIGAIVAVRDSAHFDVDLMPAPKTKREEGISKLIVHASMMLMAVVFAGYGVKFALLGYAQQSEMTGVNMLILYISFPLAGFSWIAFLIEKLIADVRLIVATSRPDADQRTASGDKLR